MIIWMVGMSGSGKTTIGRKVAAEWKKHKDNVVLIDGDEIREIFKHNNADHSYTVKGRRKNAERILELCNWLDRQNINVVCCILCIFEDILAANPSIFSEYYEVFLDSPIETLIQRDLKNLYQPAIDGKSKNVVGIDIEFSPPKNPDMTINTSEPLNAHAQALYILKEAAQL